MKELELKYGCNPHQKPAEIFMRSGELPLTVLNGRPGYINLLDALNGYGLVRELAAATGLPAATSFKHVSPAGAAVGLPLTRELAQIYFAEGELSPLACAYARARGTDRVSSFGDFIALSEVCDMETARLISREVSDGIIAPGFEKDALEILKGKRKGNYTVLAIDKEYMPSPYETKDVYGVTFRQGRNDCRIDESLLENIVTDNKELPLSAKRDLLLSMITLKYTQSNSVCYAIDGQTIGVGAGQQSRIHCTRLAGNKADLWQLRRHPSVLNLPFLDNIGRPERDNAIDVYLGDHPSDVIAEGAWQQFFKTPPAPLSPEERQGWLKDISGISMSSDAFFPFDDNIKRAHRSGVSYIAQSGGSVRDGLVIDTCNALGIVMAFTGLRLFHH